MIMSLFKGLSGPRPPGTVAMRRDEDWSAYGGGDDVADAWTLRRQ